LKCDITYIAAPAAFYGMCTGRL